MKTCLRCLLVLLCIIPAGLAAQGPDPVAPGAAREALFAEASQWVARQLNLAPQQVEFGALDARVRIPACAARQYDFPFASQGTLRVRCPENGWQLYLRLAIREVERVVMAARALPQGHTLSADDVLMRPVAVLAPDMLREGALAAGRTLRRDIRQGEPILRNDLDQSLRAVRLQVPVARGEVLRADAHEIVSVSASTAPDNVFTDVNRLEGRRAWRDLAAGELLLNEDLMLERQVLVSTRNMAAGTILSPSVASLTTLDARSTPRDAIESPEGLEFFETNRHLRSGEVIRASDLRPAALVRRGETVTLTVVRGSLQIVTRVEALGDGRLGDKVNVRNPDSGRTFSGIVTGRAMVKGL